MYYKKILIILLSFFLSLKCFSNLDYEKIGQWDLNIDASTFGMTSNSTYTTYFPGGKIKVKNGEGDIKFCIEDATLLDATRMIFEIECYVKMDDNSVLFVEYNVKVTKDSSFDQKIGDGSKITAPNNGLKYFFAEFKMKTTSEKYNWINDNIIIGKGLELRGSSKDDPPLGRAFYDLYIFKN